MNVSLSSWFVILLAIFFANLPFFNDRIFAIIPLPVAAGRLVKPFWLRLIELIVLYGVVGAIARGLESHIGNVSKQSWEFYAITVCMFIVLTFPGFVFRYLRK